MTVRDYQVKSLARAVALLEAFSLERPMLTIGELHRQSGLPRSTAHRLVVNLVRLGLLTRDPIAEKYRLGPLLARLGNVALGQIDLRETARPVLDWLARESGEAAVIAALDRPTAIYVDKVESDRHALSINSRPGDRVPLHCSGTGKCLLAFMDPDDARRLLEAAALPRLTSRTVVEGGQLLTELAAIRARGYALDTGESEDGLASIAAPVWDAADGLVAAVCVAGPAERVLERRRELLIRHVKSAADQISRALGWRGAENARASARLSGRGEALPRAPIT